jgi:hypothetical protein
MHHVEIDVPLDKLFAQWRTINQQANDAERRIFEATLAYTRGEGPPPSDKDRVLAGQLRTEARTLFQRALAEVEATASEMRKQIHPPPSPSSGDGLRG